MTRMTRYGLLTLAALVIACAMASTASAEEFIYSSTGQLKSKALGTQTFTLSASGPTIECNQLSSEGEATSLKATSLGVSIQYSKCTTFGGEEATVSLATYKFSTGLRSLTILTPEPDPPLSILIIGPVKCHFVVKTPATFSKTGEVEYENNGGKISEKSKLTGIESEVTESNEPAKCGKVGEQYSAGTFKGGQEVELVEGAIEVS